MLESGFTFDTPADFAGRLFKLVRKNMGVPDDAAVEEDDDVEEDEAPEEEATEEEAPKDRTLSESDRDEDKRVEALYDCRFHGTNVFTRRRPRERPNTVVRPSSSTERAPPRHTLRSNPRLVLLDPRSSPAVVVFEIGAPAN